MADAKIDRELVTTLYRELLGRDPESKVVVDAHVRSCTTVSELVRAFVESDEFERRTLTRIGMTNHKPFLTSNVVFRLDDDAIRQLFLRTLDQWEELGDSEPYWSVLSDPRFRAASFDDHEAEFWDSGRIALDLVNQAESNLGLSVGRGSAIDFGCGVGRLTRHLVQRFDRVYALDVSRRHLDLLHSIKGPGMERVRTVPIREPSSIMRVPRVDFVISLITLQHNPPPCSFAILRELLDRLAPGGVALIQFVSDSRSYEWPRGEDTQARPTGVEMHTLPMRAVLEAARLTNVTIVDVAADDWASNFGLSQTAVFQRAPDLPMDA